MIDIKHGSERKLESRAEKLEKKYIKVNGLDWAEMETLRDISITLAMILDEMRGIENETST